MVLKQHNTDVITMEKPVEIPKLIKEGNIDVVLLDMNFSPGIPEENLGNIFIPFFSTKKEGSGIGLSLSRQIMKLHRGRIDVETEAGAGTTFILEF